MQNGMTDLNVEGWPQGANVLPKRCCLVPSIWRQVGIHVLLIPYVVEAFTVPDEVDGLGAPLRHQLQALWQVGV